MEADIPNEETLLALEECEQLLHDSSIKRYTDIDVMIEELLNNGAVTS